MTIGKIFYMIAALLCFLGGIGSTVIPHASTWGLFCVALGLLLAEYDLGFKRRG